MLRLLWVVVVIALVASPPPVGADEGDPIAAEFDQAMAGLADGDHAKVAESLVGLADEYPDHPRAPDALFTAATLFEERLNRPARALDLYQRISNRHPDHRVARAADMRRAELERVLGPDRAGADAERRFEALRRRFGERPETESIALAEKLLADHPDWPGVIDVHLWIAEIDMRAGRYREARHRFVQAAASPGSDELKFYAGIGAVEAAVRDNAFDEAGRLLERMDPAGHPSRQAVMDEARAELGRARARALWARRASLFGLLALALLVASLVRAAGSAGKAAAALWPPPAEVIYLAPIGVALTAIAATGYRGLMVGVGLISASGLLVAWLSGAGLAAHRRRGVALKGWALGHIAVAAVAVIALAYVSIHRAGLIEPFFQTLESGPAR